MSEFTDIVQTGWVARLPASLRPYALLARLDRPIGVWLLFWPGAWGLLVAGARLGETVRLLALFAVGSLVMRGAGCVVNDMWDRDLDRQVRRTAGRPLASGALSLRQATVFLAILSAIGLAVLLQLSLAAQILGASSLLLVAVYPLAKRFTWWPQLVMGFTFGFGAPEGFVAGGGGFTLGFVTIYTAAIAWDLGFDTIYGFQDMEDDALIGVKSTSRRFAHMPRMFVGACYALTLALIAAAGAQARLGPGFWLALPVTAALLAWQVIKLDVDNPRVCLALFRQNREVGAVIALALLAGRL